MRSLPRWTSLAVAVALAAPPAFALPPGSASRGGNPEEAGDPARWRIPADTPQRRFDAEAKGSRAALAEALVECRAESAGRAACAAEAQDQFRRDMATARGVLARERVSPAPGQANDHSSPGFKNGGKNDPSK